MDVHMKLLRRALLALSVASAVAGVLRFKGKGVGAIKQGGWRKFTDKK
jgi:hypothetical protein